MAEVYHVIRESTSVDGNYIAGIFICNNGQLVNCVCLAIRCYHTVSVLAVIFLDLAVLLQKKNLCKFSTTVDNALCFRSRHRAFYHRQELEYMSTVDHSDDSDSEG